MARVIELGPLVQKPLDLSKMLFPAGRDDLGDYEEIIEHLKAALVAGRDVLGERFQFGDESVTAPLLLTYRGLSLEELIEDWLHTRHFVAGERTDELVDEWDLPSGRYVCGGRKFLLGSGFSFGFR